MKLSEILEKVSEAYNALEQASSQIEEAEHQVKKAFRVLEVIPLPESIDEVEDDREKEKSVTEEG